MAVSNPPSYLQGGSHPARGLRRMTEAMTGDTEGALAAGELAVSEKSGTPNMSVDVSAGRAFILGTESAFQGTYFVESRNIENLVVTVADATNPRKDIVVARVEDSEESGAVDAWSLEVIAGTPAASPSAPAQPAHSLLLATVDVAALASSITNANITTSTPVWPGNAVDTEQLVDGAVTEAKLAAGSVSESKLASDSVTSAKIAANAVGSSELAADSVTAAAIATGAVGASELASDSVTASAIAANAVGSGEIAADAVTLAKIADAAVEWANFTSTLKSQIRTVHPNGVTPCFYSERAGSLASAWNSIQSLAVADADGEVTSSQKGTEYTSGPFGSVNPIEGDTFEFVVLVFGEMYVYRFICTESWNGSSAKWVIAITVSLNN